MSPSQSDNLTDSLMRNVAGLQFALQVARDLLVNGPANAAQVAERLTDDRELNEEGFVYRAEQVEEAFNELDLWNLLDIQSIEDDAPIGIVGRWSR